MPTWAGSWNGGRYYLDGSGRRVFFIEKMVNHSRYLVRLDIQGGYGVLRPDHVEHPEADEQRANRELDAFREDPQGYKERLDERRAPKGVVAVNRTLVGEYAAWLRAGKRTAEWVRDQTNYLACWAYELGSADLRTLKMHQIDAHLENLGKRECRCRAQDDRRKRGRHPTKNLKGALKGFYTFLVKKEHILPTEDKGKLIEIERAVAVKKTGKRRVAYEPEFVERVYRALPTQTLRDVVLVCAKTGIHQNELRRLTDPSGEGGEIIPLPVNQRRGTPIAAIMVIYRHKSGKEHVMFIDAQTRDAIRRLSAREWRGKRVGAPDKDSIYTGIHAACAEAGIRENFCVKFLRHTFGTLGNTRGKHFTLHKEEGVPLHIVAANMGHTNTATTGKHYIDSAPPFVLLPLNLVHPDDPPVADAYTADRPRLVLAAGDGPQAGATAS